MSGFPYTACQVLDVCVVSRTFAIVFGERTLLYSIVFREPVSPSSDTPGCEADGSDAC